MPATGKKDDFQAIISQIESHNGILVNNSFESLEKVLPEYQVLHPNLNQVQIYGLVKMAGNHKKNSGMYAGVSHVSVLNQKRQKAKKFLYKFVICHKHQVKI